MADYDLSRLSSRSFEQLIQALAIKTIGPGVVPFGDGPDGGRDATFNGSFPYPSADGGWEGYGVIQAKYLQRSRDPRQDGAWVVSQLREELEKYCEPERKRRKPDYFVLATNVALTAVGEKGSKDRVASVLKEFQKRSSLKGFAIWDYDQIRVFLDNNEDVRNSNAAWITPGDVLVRIVETLSPRTPNFGSTLRNYLQKEMLNDEFVNLEQAGHDASERIPLGSVFVDLPVYVDRGSLKDANYAGVGGHLPESQAAETLNEGFIKEILEVSAEHLDPKSLSIGSDRQRSESVSSPSERSRGRYVLLGGPGQGKTTVGQFICQIFRASIVSPMPDYTLSEDVQRGLRVIGDNCRNESIELPLVPRFPFRIILNEFASALSSSSRPEVNSVLSFLVEQISKRTDRRIFADDLRDWMARYPCVFIFDGLDEVPSSNGRDQVLDSIRDFWVDASTNNADILSIATSRPQGYNDDFSPASYQHMTLAPLSNELGMHFAKRLVDVRYGTDLDRRDKVTGRLQRSFESESTSRLMRSPLQITIMTALVDRMGQPPETRWKLFEAYYNVIYQREVERNIPASELLRKYEADINAIHSRVGLLLQIDTEQRGGTESRISAQRFKAVVEERLREEGHSRNDLSELTNWIVEAASQRLVFLVGLEADRVGFEIRSLQEFMAAECLMEGRDEDVQTRLEEIAPIPNWRNVFLFAAGKCFAERQYLRDTIHSICGRLNEKCGDGIAGAHLAGSGLAMDLLEEGLTRHQPKFAQSLGRIATRALDVPNDSYHTQLAHVYEPQMEEVYIDELTSRLNDNRSHILLRAWRCLIWLVRAEIQWAIELAEEYWPAEQQMQLEILNHADELGGNSWVEEKLLELMPDAPVPELLNLIRYDSVISHLWSQDLDPEEKGMLNVLQLQDDEVTAEVAMLQSNFVGSRIVPIFGGEGSWLYLLTGFEDCDPTWSVYKCSADFLMEPSKEGLASALNEIARSVSPEYFQKVNGWYDRAPWPIAASLKLCSDTSDILQMAQRAQTGELGDRCDWAAAEERWLDSGIGEEDILSMSDDRLPFDSLIGESGFPVSLRSLESISYHREDINLIKRMLGIYNRMPKSNSRSFLSELIVLCLFHGHLSRISGDDAIEDTVTLRELQQLLADLKPDSRIPLELVLSRLQHSNGEEEIVDFFVDMACRRVSFFVFPIGRRHYSQGIERLLKAYYKFPDHEALMPVVALMAEDGLLGEHNVKTLDWERSESPGIKLDAFIIELAQQIWDIDNTTELVGIAREVCGISETSSLRILKTLQLNRYSGAFRDKFLLEFRNLLQDRDRESLRQYTSLLENSLRRRVSRFTDTDERSRFKMPQGIAPFLPR